MNLSFAAAALAAALALGGGAASAQTAAIGGGNRLWSAGGTWQEPSRLQAGSMDVRVDATRPRNEAQGERSMAYQNHGVDVSGGGQLVVSGNLGLDVRTREATNIAKGSDSTAFQNFGVVVRR